MVNKFFKLDDENLILGKKFWPGPLTLVLKRRSKEIPLSLTLNNECAVRIPNNKFTLNLIDKLGKPLVMPSANKFKQLSPINSEMVFKQFIDTNLLIIDDGKCKVGIESTLIKISNHKLKIIRPGLISLENIKKILPYMLISKRGKNLNFSGTSKKHYSPKKKIYLNVKQLKKKSAFINFGMDKKGQFKNLSRIGNLKEAAKNLYHFIYLADNNDLYENISIAPIPYKKIGLAINDRLLRASK
jgi:L-threonylcarbamoyladenylate synthase